MFACKTFIWFIPHNAPVGSQAFHVEFCSFSLVKIYCVISVVCFPLGGFQHMGDCFPVCTTMSCKTLLSLFLFSPTVQKRHICCHSKAQALKNIPELEVCVLLLPGAGPSLFSNVLAKALYWGRRGQWKIEEIKVISNED